MRRFQIGSPILRSAILMVAFASPALAGDVLIVASGSVTSVTGPGLANPGLSQLVVGQQIEFSYRADCTGNTIPGGLTYAVFATGSGVGSGTSTAEAILLSTANGVEVIDDAGGGVDSIVASMELPGQATALLEISDGTSGLLQSNALDVLIGIGFVPFGGTSLTGEIFDGASSVEVSFSIVTFDEFDGPIGLNYCMANSNSTGVAASITVQGSGVAAANDLTLVASNVPVGSFGFFITSQAQIFVPNPAGSSGNLCISGSLGRYSGPGQILQAGSTGLLSLPIDVTQMPQPNGFVAAVAGDVWNFQAWFRDSSPSGSTSNFTDGFELPFN